MIKTGKMLLFLSVLLLSMVAYAPVSRSATGSEYINDVKIVSGDSEDEVIEKLRDAGYTPVMTNIAKERPELEKAYVYVGYKTTTNADESIEGDLTEATGSVFGDAALMIGGVGIVIGVVIGMISMRIKPKGQRKPDNIDNHESDN